MGKINIVIGILTLVLTTLITAISIFYYSFILSDRQFERTKQAAQNASETLSYNYKNIMDRLTAICGTAEFSSDIRMLASPSVSYIVQERLVQNELSDLAGCNYLVQSALVPPEMEKLPIPFIKILFRIPQNFLRKKSFTGFTE